MYNNTGRFKGRPSPLRPKISQQHVIFKKCWQNCMLVLPSGGLVDPPTEILDPPLNNATLLAITE